MARHSDGGIAKRMSHRRSGVKSQQSVRRRRPETLGLCPWSRHDRRFVPPQNKMGTAARERAYAGRPTPERSDGT